MENLFIDTEGGAATRIVTPSAEICVIARLSVLTGAQTHTAAMQQAALLRLIISCDHIQDHYGGIHDLSG